MKQLGMRINKVIWEILLPGIAIFLAIVFFIGCYIIFNQL